MRLRHRLVLIGIISLLSFSTHAIEAITSYTIFYRPDAQKNLSPYIELYWQIDPNTIHFVKQGNKWVSKIVTNITIQNAAGVVVKEDKYILETKPADSLEILNQSIIELQRYSLQEGNHKISVSLYEQLLPENIYRYTDSFMIDAAATKPFYSGIELVDTAFNSPVESIFSRNNLVQVPFCNNFYNDNKAKLHFYTELYRSEWTAEDAHPLVQTAYISKKPGENAIYDLQATDTIKTAIVLPILKHFDITTLPSGNYYVNIKLQNKQGEAIASNTLFFQRSNLHPAKKENDSKDTGFVKVEVVDLDKSFVTKYTTAQLRAILKMLLPISTPLEKSTIENFQKKPEDNYIRYFVFNFWKARNDADPRKEWEIYTNRVREVNKLFGGGASPGYETDRGVIYLKYGKPDERVIVQSEPGSLPYEVWQYNAPGGQGRPGFFLFYRPGYVVNDYRLLHSTVKGEVRNSSWRFALYTKTDGNPNSRAEQYLNGR